MAFSGIVGNGPRKAQIPEGGLTYDLPNIKAKGLGYNAAYYIM